MCEVVKKKVIENGEVHWEVTVGDEFASCDWNELEETVKELKERSEKR